METNYDFRIIKSSLNTQAAFKCMTLENDCYRVSVIYEGRIEKNKTVDPSRLSVKFKPLGNFPMLIFQPKQTLLDGKEIGNMPLEEIPELASRLYGAWQSDLKLRETIRHHFPLP